jgi:hypothetical protein
MTWNVCQRVPNIDIDWVGYLRQKCDTLEALSLENRHNCLNDSVMVVVERGILQNR